MERCRAFFSSRWILRGGAVGIVGQQERVAASVNVGDVHRAVGADQAVASFGDQDAAFAPHDAAALPDGELDDASVELIALGPAAGSGGGFDCCLASTNWPSALETILCLMTRMSPWRSLLMFQRVEK